jgi:hypothetical protein
LTHAKGFPLVGGVNETHELFWTHRAVGALFLDGLGDFDGEMCEQDAAQGRGAAKLALEPLIAHQGTGVDLVWTPAEIARQNRLDAIQVFFERQSAA